MTELTRRISKPLLSLYGLGTIIGAGIYVLTGVVAGEAGEFAPVAFLLAALVAAPTAWSYSVLSSRFPRSAGEAVYIQEAFHRRWLASLVGALVVIVGVISAATIARGFVGYLQVFFELPAWLIVVLLVSFLTTLAVYGVLESVGFAALIAIISILGLLLVIVGGITQSSYQDVDVLPPLVAAPWAGIMAGAFLAFYAFIGFEDIVNMAEETVEPESTLPVAILISLLGASFLYFLVTYVAVLTVPVKELSASTAPMALVVEHHGLFNPRMVAVISMLAVVNSALVQIIMASRVIYGVARMHHVSGTGQVMAWLASVNGRTRTPVNATLLIGGVILLLALALDVRMLASLTSATTLAIFLLVNLALCRLQDNRLNRPAMLVPWLAAILTLMLLTMSFML